MNDSQNAPEGVYTLTLERENEELQQAQTRRINESMRHVRSISKESQQFARTVVVEDIQETISAEEEPGFYVESPGTIERVSSAREDDTGRFSIPEPDISAIVSKALDQAFLLIEKERREFRASKDSPVIKRWRII